MISTCDFIWKQPHQPKNEKLREHKKQIKQEKKPRHFELLIGILWMSTKVNREYWVWRTSYLSHQFYLVVPKHFYVWLKKILLCARFGWMRYTDGITRSPIHLNLKLGLRFDSLIWSFDLKNFHFYRKWKYNWLILIQLLNWEIIFLESWSIKYLALFQHFIFLFMSKVENNSCTSKRFSRFKSRMVLFFALVVSNCQRFKRSGLVLEQPCLPSSKKHEEKGK